MPTYSYTCLVCKQHFELFAYIKDYTETPKCIHCESCRTERMFTKDVITQFSSVKKSDTELKTIGDLALRNSERMSNDEKTHLYQKHNAYKYEQPDKALPSGMNRIKKPPKPNWPGTKKIKTKRKNKKQ